MSNTTATMLPADWQRAAIYWGHVAAGYARTGKEGLARLSGAMAAHCARMYLLTF